MSTYTEDRPQSKKKKGRYPQDQDLEYSVLGSCILNGSHWWGEVERAAGGVSDDDLDSIFYGAESLLAARAISRSKSLSTTGEVNPQAFRSAYAALVEDGKEGTTEQVAISLITKGGFNTLDSLRSGINRLVDLSRKREMIDGVERVLNNLYDPQSSAYESADSLRQISTHGVVSEPSLTSREVLERIDNIEISPWQVSTGIRKLDKMLGGGFEPGRLSVAAARPKVGKTTLALNAALNAAVEQDIVTLFVSLEMNDREIMAKMIANLSSIEHRTVMKILNREEGSSVRDLPPDQREHYLAAREDISDAPLHMMFAENTKRGVNDVVDSAMALRAKYGPDRAIAVFFDYLQLGVSDKSNARAELDDITRKLKIMALELNIAVITLSQVNRSGAGEGMPSPHQMRESGGIEQDADVVIMLHRETEDEEGEEIESDTMELWLALNRNGPTGHAEARWEPGISLIEDIEQEEASFTVRPSRKPKEDDFGDGAPRRPRRRGTDFEEEEDY